MTDPELSRAAWAIESEQEQRRMLEDRWQYVVLDGGFWAVALSDGP